MVFAQQKSKIFEDYKKDKSFHPSKVVISQGKLQVSAPEVANPVAVRYAF
ncbi:hypothetical protein FEM08_23970 [Flavobacterium gilvum]|nr:hypothetical protein FEM08_23970 [Flavobacterium gilvum]